jgi:hypothetical protein
MPNSWFSPLVPRFVLKSLPVLAAISFGAANLPAAAQSAPADLTDLPANMQTRHAIVDMLRQGIMKPRAATTFSPEETSTLGEYLSSLQKLFSLPPSTQPVTFNDVPQGSRYYAAVQAAAPYLNRQAMCAGCALSKNLYPDQPLTHAQSSVALVAILNARGKLPLVDDTTARQMLASAADLGQLAPLGRRLIATGLSASLLPLPNAAATGLNVAQTRANTALMLSKAQARFQLLP